MSSPAAAGLEKRIGIMLGRLSHRSGERIQGFPWLTWQDEFDSAAACGFTSLEWLVTSEGLEDNPLWTDDGTASIRRQIARTGIEVHSVCADYFISRPLMRVSGVLLSQGLDVLHHLIRQSAQLNVAVILLPMLEENEIRHPKEADALLRVLAPAMSAATACGIRIGLETSLPPDELLELLPRGSSLNAHVYYDTGNAASMGRDAGAELRALAPLLAGVHIKDRLLHGKSVPLGAGTADFETIIEALVASGYEGTLILETPVGSDPVASACSNLDFVRERIAMARQQYQSQ